MKKKIANGIELLFLLASLVMLLIPTTLPSSSVMETWGEKTSVMNLIGIYPINAIPLYVWFALCTIMCVVSIISKNTQKDGFIHSLVAILLFIQTNWCLISTTGSDGILMTNFPTGIFEICLFAVVVMSFVKRSAMIVGAPEVKVTVETNAANATSADELKKYKALLDSGAITEEEYEAKKKQLLGL